MQTMTKTHFGYLSLVLIILSFSACSVEKRVHQAGYHISWKHRHVSPSQKTSDQIVQAYVELTPTSFAENPNVHSTETISASSTFEQESIASPRNTFHSIKNKSVNSDTIIPSRPPQREEYFSNNYTPPDRNTELADTKLANWALGLGIGAISTPVTILLLIFIGAAYAAANSLSISIYLILGLAFLIGGISFLVMDILAIIFAIRFLRLHGKDPNYSKYRRRAITGLILAGIYPAFLILNIMVALAFI